jgi:hypothetical protein
MLMLSFSPSIRNYGFDLHCRGGASGVAIGDKDDAPLVADGILLLLDAAKR